MKRTAGRWALGLTLSVLHVWSASAQEPPSLKAELLDVANPSLGHGAQLNTNWMYPLATLVGIELSTQPLGTSSGGFTFSFDKTLGITVRSSHSFGPAFSERAVTVGRSKFSLGFNYLHASYNSLGGLNLRNGDLKTFVSNGRGAPAITQDVRLNLVSDTAVVFGGVGLGDGVDLGFAVPLISVTMSGQADTFSTPGIGSEPYPPDVRSIPLDPVPFGDARNRRQATSAGLGDITLSAKFRLLRIEEGGLAINTELHLPTGDADNFRGLGITRPSVSAIWSRGGTIAPHANLGYEFWSSGISMTKPCVPGNGFDCATEKRLEAKDIIKYAIGIEALPSPKGTVVIDVVGRTVRHGGKIGYADVSGLRDLFSLDGGVSTLSVVPGLKWNPTATLLLSANVLVPLNVQKVLPSLSEGLRTGLVPVVGVEWAF